MVSQRRYDSLCGGCVLKSDAARWTGRCRRVHRTAHDVRLVCKQRPLAVGARRFVGALLSVSHHGSIWHAQRLNTRNLYPVAAPDNLDRFSDQTSTRNTARLDTTWETPFVPVRCSCLACFRPSGPCKSCLLAVCDIPSDSSSATAFFDDETDSRLLPMLRGLPRNCSRCGPILTTAPTMSTPSESSFTQQVCLAC
jgi:hypothetical protein